SADTTLAGGASPVDSTRTAAATDSTASAAQGRTSGVPPGSGPFGGFGGTTPRAPPQPTPQEALAAAQRPQIERGYCPEFNSKVVRGNDGQNLTSTLSSRFEDPSHIALSNTLGYDKNYLFTQNLIYDSRRIMNSLSVPLRRTGFSFNLNTSNV